MTRFAPAFGSTDSASRFVPLSSADSDFSILFSWSNPATAPAAFLASFDVLFSRLVAATDWAYVFPNTLDVNAAIFCAARASPDMSALTAGIITCKIGVKATCKFPFKAFRDAANCSFDVSAPPIRSRNARKAAYKPAIRTADLNALLILRPRPLTLCPTSLTDFEAFLLHAGKGFPEAVSDTLSTLGGRSFQG
mgnify:FL=1